MRTAAKRPTPSRSVAHPNFQIRNSKLGFSTVLDCLIVGAGPAGATAALVLARAGVRVRLVDRAEFPRDKLCGDTLNPGNEGFVNQLSPMRDETQRCAPVHGF